MSAGGHAYRAKEKVGALSRVVNASEISERGSQVKQPRKPVEKAGRERQLSKASRQRPTISSDEPVFKLGPRNGFSVPSRLPFRTML